MKFIVTYTRKKTIEFEANGYEEADLKANESKPKGYELADIEKESDIIRSKKLRDNHGRNHQ